MCRNHAGPSHPKQQGRRAVEEAMALRPEEWPGDWEEMELPPAHVLSHLTDAHCHPTDLQHDPEVYDAVKLGGLASMGTIVDDQERVRALGTERPWRVGEGSRPKGTVGPRVVSCFGYHPWFSHRYTLSVEPISRESHYTSIFFPPTPQPTSARKEKEKQVLAALLPFLPDPIPFSALVDGVRANLQRARFEGRLCMLGEVGLDGGARVLWPKDARHLYDESTKSLKRDDGPGKEGEGTDEDEWKRLTPFKISMAHQRAILEAQMEVAVELGMPVSLHCVAAPGPTFDVLKSFRDRYGPHFTNRVNVDLHSGGGWSPEFYASAAAQLSNLYVSPSIFITARHISAPGLIRALHPDRILVESDSHDVCLSDRLVWGAVEWVARVRRWELESRETAEWDLVKEGTSDEEWLERYGRKGVSDGKPTRGRRGGEEVWAVRTIERNWARFMGLIEPYE